MTTATPALDAPLSAAMRDGSRVEHEQAESSPFTSELVAGRIDAAGYAAYLLRLRVVYAALESVGREQRDHAAVAAVHDPALERLEAIDEDLEHWAPGGRHDVESPAAHAYADRIRAAGADGELYLAHHYTRYLGDLSGGQAIGRVLERTFDLDGRGVAFYRFDAVPKPKPYKDAYRARLDALHLDVGAKARVVDEVRLAFGLNQALFEELGELVLPR